MCIRDSNTNYHPVNRNDKRWKLKRKWPPQPIMLCFCPHRNDEWAISTSFPRKSWPSSAWRESKPLTQTQTQLNLLTSVVERSILFDILEKWDGAFLYEFTLLHKIGKKFPLVVNNFHNNFYRHRVKICQWKQDKSTVGLYTSTWRIPPIFGTLFGYI